jgi:enoyl-CoA hydratase/carnithine racemase
MPPPASELLVEREGGVALLTLHRPEAMNALSLGLRRALARAFREVAEDPGSER